MARPATPIWDPTDLDGARIDVGARIGWLLRVSREGAGVNLAEMSRRLAGGSAPLSVASISALERNGQRDGRLLDAYESALDLPVGQLRAPVDTVCRVFPYAPLDRTPGLSGTTGLARLDSLLERVHEGRATGGDWFTLARGLGVDQVWMIPSRHVQPLVEQLLGECVRAVGTAYATRYEAVAALRCGGYADLVEDVVRGMVDDEGAQGVVATALCAASERPTARLLAWVASLLTRPALPVVRGAAMALENMRAIGGLDPADWQVVAPHFLAAYDAAHGRDDVGRLLTTLYKNLPPDLRRDILARLPGPLAPVYVPASWSADHRNVHYAVCDRLAGEATAAAGLAEQPMLARMLFELIYDFRAIRVHGAGFWLMASPVVEALQCRLACLSVEGFDETTRHGALRGLLHLQVPRGHEQLQAWFDASRPHGSPVALAIAGNAGLRVDESLLDQVGDDSALGLATLECLGMVEHPGLAGVAADPTRSAAVRATAGWWLRHGGRVTE